MGQFERFEEKAESLDGCGLAVVGGHDARESRKGKGRVAVPKAWDVPHSHPDETAVAVPPS